MVVAFDDVEKNAKLSLRQSEILEKLANICNDLSDETDDRQVLLPRCFCATEHFSSQYRHSDIPSRVWALYARVYTWPPLYRMSVGSALC